ncbi:MAG: hypothetical protein LBS84_00460 [Clostridiales bacterium]|nr:hypothetical protein [Clostridiales bacterium]
MSEYLKNFLAVEGKKLKEMTFKEKAAYIWEYYKIPIIAVIVVLFIAGSIIDSVWIHPPKKLFLQIGFSGGYVADESMNALNAALTEAIMTPEERETLQVTGTLFMYGSGDPQMDMANQAKFAAMIASNEIDLLVMSLEELESSAAQGLLLPLTDVLPESVLSSLSDRLTQAVNDSGERADFALKLDGCEVFAENGLIADGQCLGVIVNSIQQDHALKAIEYIFGL